MKPKFVLKQIHEDGCIESYIPKKQNQKKIKDPQEQSKQKKNNSEQKLVYPNKKQVRKNRSIYTKMLKKPSKYFNFGFGPREYCLFLNKHFFMRAEKNLIKTKLNQKIKKK